MRRALARLPTLLARGTAPHSAAALPQHPQAPPSSSAAPALPPRLPATPASPALPWCPPPPPALHSLARHYHPSMSLSLSPTVPGLPAHRGALPVGPPPAQAALAPCPPRSLPCPGPAPPSWHPALPLRLSSPHAAVYAPAWGASHAAQAHAPASLSTGVGASGQVASPPAEDLETVSLVSQLERALGTPFSDTPLVAEHQGLVVVISGPSGVGKDAVIRRLQEVRPSLHFVVTATSRAMRPGEVHGQDYLFVSRDRFEDMIEGNELLEHALVYGEYKGIPKSQIREAVEQSTDVVLRLDVQGAATVRRLLEGGGVFVFLTAESEAALVKRLVGRKTEPMERLLVRVATARKELRRVEEFDYVVVNQEGRLEETVQALCSIIDAEKAKVHRQPMKF